MAGQIKVAVVSGPISSGGTGTADFIKAGFGTPKACKIFLSFDTADDAAVSAEGKASVGFSIFTSHRCITHQDEDGSAKVDSDARKSPTRAYVLLDIAGAVDIDGTASAIADGVRLTNLTNVPALAVFATVVMYGGADLQVSLDSVSLPNAIGGTTVVTTGIPQDLVFFIGTDIAGEDTSSTGINNSFGVADISNNQATIINRCMGWCSDHNANVGSPGSIIRNDRCLKILTEAGADDWGVELTAATTTSYTITVRDVIPGAGMEVYALALNLDDRGSKVGSVDSPTAGPTWTPAVALGFTPQYVGLGVTHAQVEGTIETDADAGGLGISSNTGTVATRTDDFNRADASDLGANWTKQFGQAADRMGIFGNGVDVTIVGNVHGELYTGASFGNDQRSKIVSVIVPTSELSARVRGSSTVLSYYAGGFNTNDFAAGLRIWKYVSGASTSLVNKAWTFVAGDDYELRVNGDQLSLYVNGTLELGPVTDSSLASGPPGIGVFHGTTNVKVLDDWEGGDLSEATFHGWYNEDAAPTINTNNNFRSRVLDFRSHDVGTVVHDHSHLSFNNGDWTYTINIENETTARKWFYWAIEEIAVIADERHQTRHMQQSWGYH